jgi:hypothetical protein
MTDIEQMDVPDPAPVRPAAAWLRYDSRADGWTAGRRAAFLAHLADNGVVADAASAVGKSLASAYALRRRAGGYAFALGWEAALLLARRRVADELMASAIKGEQAVWVREEGRTVYTRFNSRIALALLDRVNPATALNEVLAVTQNFDWFLDLIDDAENAESFWHLFDLFLDQSDFAARNRVRASLQLSDESVDFDKRDADDPLPTEVKGMPRAVTCGQEHPLFPCRRGDLMHLPSLYHLNKTAETPILRAFGDGGVYGDPVGRPSDDTFGP